MGTRCLTFVYNEVYEPLVAIYRQFDGYPGGHGKEIASFLKDRTIINGIPPEKMMMKVSNGMDCLAASLVAELKNEVGNIYIVPIYTKNCDQDYEYHIYDETVVVKNYNGEVMFSGKWNLLENFCSEDDE